MSAPPLARYELAQLDEIVDDRELDRLRDQHRLDRFVRRLLREVARPAKANPLGVRSTVGLARRAAAPVATSRTAPTPPGARSSPSRRPRRGCGRARSPDRRSCRAVARVLVRGSSG